jgi:predicted AAA+ superfamily ATPase
VLDEIQRRPDLFPVLRTFVLTKEESESLRSQIATLKKGRGEHRKYLPRVFTEHGALMAASILSSPKAVDMSIQVVRAFVRLQHRRIGARTTPQPLYAVICSGV